MKLPFYPAPRMAVCATFAALLISAAAHAGEVIFEEVFFLDDETRKRGGSIHGIQVGSNESGLLPSGYTWEAFEQGTSATISSPGGDRVGPSGLFYENQPEGFAVVSLSIPKLAAFSELTLTAKFSAFNTEGAAFGFSSSKDVGFSDESGDALYLRLGGRLETRADAPVELVARVGGTEHVLQTFEAVDRTGANEDLATLTYNPAKGTVTATFYDGKRKAESVFDKISLSSVGVSAPLDLSSVKIEVTSIGGRHGNFPRWRMIKLEGSR